MNIGFIGFGVMGAPMAAHLAQANHAIFTSLNSSNLPAELADKKVTVLNSPAHVAEQCQTIITMLPDSPDVQRVVAGDNGLLEHIGDNSLIIDMSSISPQVTTELAQQVNAKGAQYLDAPVSGGEIGAKAATLTIMVGGPEAAFDQARPLFERMGKNINLIGTHNGAGQTCKIANQIIVALNIEAVSEALLFASKAGCDPSIVREALMGGFAASKILEVHGQRMIDRSFDPGFRIRLHQKDLNLALESARSMALSLPNTATCQELFNACAASGNSEDDHSGMVKALEKLAAHTLT